MPRSRHRDARAFAQVADTLWELGPVTQEPVLGLNGIFVEDRFVGVIVNEHVYFRTAPHTKHRYHAPECCPLRLPGGVFGDADLPFHRIPRSALHTEGEMLGLAYEALALT